MAHLSTGRLVRLGITAVAAAGIAAGTTGVALAATGRHQNTADQTTSSTSSGRASSSASTPSPAASPPASPSSGHGAPPSRPCDHMHSSR